MEHPLRIDNREELVHLLTEASELEQGIMCGYLFAAFTLKTDTSEGVTADQLEAITRWKRTIYGVASQEMLHLSLVSNVLTALGAAPHFIRPNFPARLRYYPPGFQLALTRFDDETLRHFIYLERPEGVVLEDGYAPAVLTPVETQPDDEDEIVPLEQAFATVGHLYRGIEDGLRHLVDRFGESKVFIGPSKAQATRDYFNFPELIPVTDLASAIQAIETIVEQGEGARGDIEHSHYNQWLTVHDEYAAFKQADSGFEPARPVICNPFSRMPVDTEGVNLIGDPQSMHVCNLFDGCYEALVLMLARFFAHTEETEEELKTLIDVAIDAMFNVIEPLGELITTLPAGPAHLGQNAGPSFHFYRAVHVLPHKRAAWAVFHERLLELGDYCGRISSGPDSQAGLTEIASSLADLAGRIEPHA